MSQRAFYFDGTRCTGCKTCVYACKDKYSLDVGYAFRKVYEYTGGQTTKDENGVCTTDCFSYYMSVACNHCDDPACVHACPTGAMHKQDGDGVVLVDDTKCVGCGYCHMACPYNAPKVDPEKKHSIKCDFCEDIVSQGQEPACVAACPARALQFGDAEDMGMLGDRMDIAPMPDEGFTHPNTYITPCQDAEATDSTLGHIGNPQEVK